uniref:Uncharacterized protein n=1 Tax=Cebus imitator TaxID=2715852 RepID=A0A2K5QST5_CEBIM
MGILKRGAACCLLTAWRGKSLCFFFSVFFSVFSHQRADGFQTRTLP